MKANLGTSAALNLYQRTILFRVASTCPLVISRKQQNMQVLLLFWIAKLMRERAAQKSKHQPAKRRIVSAAGLNPAAVNKDEFYSKIPEITINLLATPFPPPYLYVSESGEIYEKNMEFVLE